MKKYLALSGIFVLLVVGLFLVPVSAHMAEPDSGFGQHVASMAPGHAVMHRAMFGHMVSDMAQGNTCLHY